MTNVKTNLPETSSINQAENIISEKQKNTAENEDTKKSEEEINAEKEFINQIKNIYNLQLLRFAS